ncbi:MAG TPA: ATP-binding protein [Polyangiaceae bacterium]|nr:ATP-binding protein [Polyangiaceae bacterium]
MSAGTDSAGASGGAASELDERRPGDRPARKKRTVATRVLLSYALVTAAFLVADGWAVTALRTAAREAVLMRSGYLPLALTVRDVVGAQDVWNTQLNHVTTAKNPADQRAWFDIALRGGRPQAFVALRAAIVAAFSSDPALSTVSAELSGEATDIERFLDADRELVARLFDALNGSDAERAEQIREQLVTRGHQGKKRLSQLEQRVQRLVDSLISVAQSRERWAMRLLGALTAFTAIVGIVMAAYARRVLEPLARVTLRAKAVAGGDLTPHPVVATNDEIGELAQTFEAMVQAIARANADLLAAERLATIGKMAAHVTHEIRNPLSSLALNVELLEEEIEDDAEARALIRAIKNEIERLTALSERYLSVGRRKPPRLEKEDVGQICRDALDFMRKDLEQHRIQVVLEIDDSLPPVSVDEGQIRQALYNLLRNAREAMPDGGAIRLVARAQGERGVEIVVEDEGAGIDEEKRARLFEPFFTTKAHGTGLGLVITREVVEAHGGTIRAEPRTPKGTRFVVFLPATPPSPATAASEARH